MFRKLRERLIPVRAEPAVPPITIVLDFLFEPMASQEAVRQQIKACEGQHVQQVCYSTFMDALTQVCFTEGRVRSNARWEGAESWTAESEAVANDQT